jgi:hypothetical protein
MCPFLMTYLEADGHQWDYVMGREG